MIDGETMTPESVVARWKEEEQLWKEYEKKLLAALNAFIEHVEEQNVLIAEVYLAHGYNPDILDELCKNHSGHTLREFTRMYEQFCRDARKEFSLPKTTSV